MIRTVTARLLTGCATGAVVALSCAPASGQTTVSNTAGFNYTGADGVQRGGQSNTVQTQILPTPPQAQVSFYVANPGGTATNVAGGCGGMAPAVVNLVPAQAAAPGTDLYVVVGDPSANRSPTTVESTFITIRSGSASVGLTLVETGANTGVFAGVLRTTIGAAQTDACTLPVTSNGNLSGTYGNAVSPVAVPVLTITPYDVVFDSATRQIVDGSTVSIVDASTGAPAQPIGVDGRSAYPSTVVAGQTYTDAAGHAYLVPKGGFTFPMLPPGSYRIVVKAPDGHVFPSASTPADFADRPVIAGKSIDVRADASYGKAFTVATLSGFDADVPLDGAAGSIVVSKTASVSRVSPGDYVQYTVQVQNAATGPLARPVMLDSMPSGLRYQKGSFRIDGAKAADPQISSDGSTLTEILPAVDMGKTHTLTYVAAVTSNAPIGTAVNAVVVRAGGTTSTVAKAAITIDGGLFTDAVTIIGRVVSDSCMATSKAAKPVEGVRILLEDGTYVVTDALGQYHIENVRPGLHVAQLDRNSIPEGFRPARCGDDTRRARSDISQFVDARGGALWRADFYLERITPTGMTAAKPASALPILPVVTTPAPTTATPTTATPTPAPTPPATVAGDASSRATTVVESALDTTIVSAPATPATPAPAAPKGPPPELTADQKAAIAAAGGGIEWIQRAVPGTTDILFPAVGYNPRSPITRIVVEHGFKDVATVRVDGKAVDPLLFDGGTPNGAKTAAISVWSAVPLRDGDNLVEVDVRSPDGKVAHLSRTVTYVNTADRAEFVPTSSRLVADGRTNPVVAIRILDRKGHPVRSGVSGQLDVSSPYETADAVKRRRESQLVASTAAAQTTWNVKGDDGVAYVELAPTTQTGEVRLNMHLRDGVQGLSHLQTSGSVLDRRDEISAWLSPGQQDWVVVGFAAGSAGYTTIARQAETLSANPGDTSIVDGQAKLYAKGRIKGRWLLTLAYDSQKKSDRQRRQSVLTTVDPDAYYTLYGDSAQQGYDAQSTQNVYVKLETRQFYALFGDFSTGIADTELGQYQRVLTGLKTQYKSQKTAITAYAAKTAYRHGRDEIQGQGLVGPYQLQRRDIVLNTETVRIETRDATRPELVLQSRDLVRYQDYDLDYARGTITLRAPLMSRDPSFNPNVMVIDYETNGSTEDRLVAGARATRQVGSRVQVGAGIVHDDGDERTTMGTVDATARIDQATRVHAEGGYSTGIGQTGHAYVVEAQRTTGSYDARAYVREQSLDFGVGQQNAVDAGFRKTGVDLAAKVRTGLEAALSVYDLQSLTSVADRVGVKGELRAQIDPSTTVSALVQRVSQTDATGLSSSTTQIGGNLSRSFLSGRLVTTGTAQISLDDGATVSTPSRYGIGATYQLTRNVRILANDDVATGSGATAQNVRVGAEVRPWSGAALTGSWNKQDILENGERTYGAFGAKQSFHLSRAWSADLSLDSERTISGRIAADAVNPLQAPVIGGRIDDGLLDQDFTSVSAGLAYQTKRSSWTGRIETRLGENRRYGVSTSFVHQLTEGQVWGGSAAAYRLNQYDGGRVDHMDAAASIALRRPTSRLQILDKLQMVYDGVHVGTQVAVPTTTYGDALVANATAVQTLANDAGDLVAASTSDATSMRFINNLAVNWIAAGSEDRGTRTQISFYYGAKYGIQTFDGQRFAGLTDMASIEARHDLTTWLDVGVQAGARHSWSQGTMQWSLGPTVGVSPARNVWISAGYNVTGFRDRDFSGAEATVKGPWIAFRLKLDEQTLGLARRR